MTTPDFRIFKRDVTANCCPEFVALCGGKVLDIYVFDANRHVCVCEMTPSYEMNFIEGAAGGEYPEDKGEEVDEALREANLHTEPVIYIHVSDIDLELCEQYGELTEWPELLESWEGDKEKAYEAALEGVLEYYQGNPEW